MSETDKATAPSESDGQQTTLWTRLYTLAFQFYAALAIGLFAFFLVSAAIEIIHVEPTPEPDASQSSQADAAPSAPLERQKAAPEQTHDFETPLFRFAAKVLNGVGFGGALLLAALVGVLSIPLVIYRASLQIQNQETAEKALAETERANTETLRLSRETAERANITDRLLRATELLGAVHNRTRTEIRTVTETSSGGGKPAQRTTKQVPVTETVQEPNIEIRIGAIHLLEQIAKEPDPVTGRLANHGSILATLLAYLRERQTEANGRAPIDWTAFEQEPEPDAPIEDRLGWAERKRDWLDARIREARNCIPEDVATAIAFLRRRDEAQLIEELDPDDTLPDWKAFEIANGVEPGADAPVAERDQYARKKQAFVGEWKQPRRPLSPAGTPLHGVDLHEVDARKQDLRQARLEGADLWEARLEDANLLDCVLAKQSAEAAPSHASSDGAASADARNLTQEQLDSCFGHKQMRLPDDLEHPEHWADAPFEDWTEGDRAWAQWRTVRGLPVLPQHHKNVDE